MKSMRDILKEQLKRPIGIPTKSKIQNFQDYDRTEKQSQGIKGPDNGSNDQMEIYEEPY